MGLAPIVLAWVALTGSGAAPPADCPTLERCLASVESTAADDDAITPREQELARALQRYGGKAAPGLLAMLKSPRRAVRSLAAYTLRDLDGLTEREVPALLAALEAGDTWVAPALGRVGSRPALEGLLADLRARPEPHTQTTYAFKKAGERAVPVLLGAFACPAGCDRDLLDALVAVFDELGAEGASATDGLVAIAGDDRRPLAVRRAALSSLGAVGENAARAAPTVQRLGRTAPKDFGDLVQPILEQMKSPAAVDALVAKLRTAPDDVTLIQIARLKGAGRGAGPTLVGLLGHRDWDVRRGAARAIGYVGYAAAAAPLQAALRNEEDWRLVYAAAESLGRLKDPTATAPLAALGDYWFPPVRSVALEAVSVISGGVEHESGWPEKNFAFELGELEHVGSELRCASSPEDVQMGTGVNDDLARARAQGLTYDAAIVGYGAGPGGKPQRHENRVRQNPNAALELPQGWLLGASRGEWGGEVVFVDRRGHQQMVLDDNISVLARLGKRIVAVGGLAHLTMNHGIVSQLVVDAQGRWSAKPWRVLPGSPSAAWINRDGRLHVRTSGGDVLLSEGGQLAMAACELVKERGARTPRP